MEGKGVTACVRECAETFFFFLPSTTDDFDIFSFSTYHSLNHVWSLHAQTLHCLKNVQETLSFHPLQNVTECNKGTSPTCTGTETEGRILSALASH